MSDRKIDGPAAGRPPTPPSDDESFNDDIVAARIKGQEAAQARQAGERLAAQVPRDVLRAGEKVERAASFLAAGEGSADRAQRAGPGAERRSAAAGARAARQGLTGERLEARLENMLAALAALEDDLSADAADPADTAAAGAGGRAAAGGAQGGPLRAPLAGRMLRLELQLRQQFQDLIAGALGFRLLADPRPSFRRLFDRLGRWPRRVAPGRRPESDEDFDAFLAWVFAPPERPDDVDEPFATHGR